MSESAPASSPKPARSHRRIIGLIARCCSIAAVVVAVGMLALLAYVVINRDRYLIGLRGWGFYAVAPGTVLLICAVALRSSQTWRIRLMLPVLMGLAMLWVGELVLTFLPAANAVEQTRVERDRKVAKAEVKFDRRNKWEVVGELREQGIDATVPVAPKLVLQSDGGTLVSVLKDNGKPVLPLGGISKTLTVHSNESGKWVKYVSDRFGFNNPDALWDERRLDIALIGDSYVQGAGVGPDENLVASVRKHFPRTVGLGCNGNGPLTELATIKEYLSEHKPRVVLWVYYEGNDLRDMANERRSPLLRAYLENDETHELTTRQETLDKLMRDMLARPQAYQVAPPSKTWKTIKEIAALKQLRFRLRVDFAAPPDIEYFGKVLEDASRYVEQWGGQVVFVYLPQWDRYGGSVWNDAHREPVLAKAREVGLTVIDPHTLIAKMDEPLSLFPFGLHGHFNAKGCQIVADHIAQVIEPKLKKDDATTAP